MRSYFPKNFADCSRLEVSPMKIIHVEVIAHLSNWTSNRQHPPKKKIGVDIVMLQVDQA